MAKVNEKFVKKYYDDTCGEIHGPEMDSTTLHLVLQDDPTGVGFYLGSVLLDDLLDEKVTPDEAAVELAESYWQEILKFVDTKKTKHEITFDETGYYIDDNYIDKSVCHGAACYDLSYYLDSLD